MLSLVLFGTSAKRSILSYATSSLRSATCRTSGTPVFLAVLQTQKTNIQWPAESRDILSNEVGNSLTGLIV